jgi:hypothetical protein
MSNGYRLDYFMMDTAVPEESTPDEQFYDKPITNGHSCKHHHGYRPKKLINPFDKGTFGNCTDFCIGNNDHMYYQLHKLPEPMPTIRKAPTAITPAVTASAISIKTALLSKDPHGDHLV